MIQVPSYWSPPSHCAIVQLGYKSELYICSVERVSLASLFFTFDPLILYDSPQDVERKFPSSSCFSVVVDRVENGTYYYTPCSANRNENEVRESNDATKLRLYYPPYTSIARSLTLEGEKMGIRSTLASIKSFTVGKFVCIGASIQIRGKQFRVVQMELKKGFKGIAFVGANCSIKLNGDASSAPSPLTHNEMLFGLDKEIMYFCDILSSITALPRGRDQWVVIDGPKGCGVHSLFRLCTQKFCRDIEVLRWSLSFDLSDELKRVRSDTLILLIDPLEFFFPVDDNSESELVLRILEKDVDRLKSASLSVLIVGLTHSVKNSCSSSTVKTRFRHNISISLPDTATRVAIIQHYSAESCGTFWHEKGHATVGMSTREVIDAAKNPLWKAKSLFSTTWDSVCGLDDVKDQIKNALIFPYRNAEAVRRFNIDPVKGILLYGPPGCAKTTLVKAICNESKFSLIYLDSAKIVSAYVGESERELRDVFTRAFEMAPCIVFFDEVEVIGGERSASDSAENRTRLLTTLLTELDGFSSKKGVCFIGATNVPHLLDSALLRPGRFDHLVYVPLPNKTDRISILKHYLSAVSVDFEKLSASTEGFSGADLRSFCSTALLDFFDNDQNDCNLLRDTNFATSYLLERAEAFHIRGYDDQAISRFREAHCSRL